MTSLVSPIYTTTLNGQRFRFFRAPTDRPELPWHAVDDLYRALGLSRDMRRDILRMTRERWGKELRTIATPDGPTVIAPHFVAQGMICVVEDMGRAKGTYTAYAIIGAEAVDELLRGFKSQDAIAYSISIYENMFGPSGGAA